MYRLIILTAIIVLAYFAYDSYGYRYYLGKVRASADTTMVMGAEDADISIIVYVDYDSSASRRIYTTLLNYLATDPHAQLIVRPVESDSNMSKLMTRIALAAKQQGKFMAVNNFFLTTQVSLDERYISTALRSMGLDFNRLKTVLNNRRIKEDVEKIALEKKMLGIPSLPFFYMNYIKMDGRQIYTVQDLRQMALDLRSGRQ